MHTHGIKIFMYLFIYIYIYKQARVLSEEIGFFDNFQSE